MVCYENFWPYKYIQTQKKNGTDGVISEAVILNKSTTTHKKNKIRMVRYQRLTLCKFIKTQKNKVRMVCYQKLPP